MRAEKITLVLLLIFISLLWSCNSSESGSTTPTRSGEAVISTAQAYAEQTRQATLQTQPPTPITSSTTSSLETPTPKLSNTPEVPIVIANYNAFVRDGPDKEFDSIDFFLEGQTAEIVGRFENLVTGTWWYIDRIGDGKDGWVWGGAVTLSGNADGVPVLESPPTPEGE